MFRKKMLTLQSNNCYITVFQILIMVLSAENILLIGAIIWFVSILLSKTGYKFGVPVLLVFLLVGMLFGAAATYS